ncbi:hypothetical protein DPSP01_010481 [Paraphaeosphaeria sporulosa]
MVRSSLKHRVPWRTALIGPPHETRRKWRAAQRQHRDGQESDSAVRRAFLITTQSRVAPAANTQTPALQPSAHRSPSIPCSLSFAPSTIPLQRAFQTRLRACRSLSVTQPN